MTYLLMLYILNPICFLQVCFILATINQAKNKKKQKNDFFYFLVFFCAHNNLDYFDIKVTEYTQISLS